MPQPEPEPGQPGLGAEPGLCGDCRHAKLTLTRRGTAYLRCLAAATDKSLPRYPRLPVAECPAHQPAGSAADSL